MRNIKLLLFTLAYLCACMAQAQVYHYSPKSVLPVEEKTIKGKLDNGFTYYIRQNSVPSNKVELRLVINAGSILETDTQQGLGHFLEHMSFNGTKSFPDATMIKTFESIGVRFGHELNAYTSFDETVYYLPIASDKVDMGLTAMEDWAMNLTLSEKEIDRERGVVIEELRLGKGASTRIREKYLPVLFGGSRYPIRLPIGKEEILKNFTYDELRKFYKEWHRPDLMAVMVVGDINSKEIEQKIVQRFGTYSMPKNSKPRPSFPVPAHKETKFVLATDPETSGCSVEISYKHTPKKVSTQQEYVRDYLYDVLYSFMINERLREIQEGDEPPFLEAESQYSNYFREVDTYSSYARCAPNQVLDAFKALITENERVKRYGFSENELNRAKTKLLSRYEQWYNEREKTSSDRYADEFQVNYLKGTPIPGIEYEYTMLKDVLPRIKASDLESLASGYMTESNRVIVVTGPDEKKIAYPKEQAFSQLLDSVSRMKITPYDEGKVVTSLMSSVGEPVPGTIVAEKTFPETGMVQWNLSNGTTVVFKTTDFRNDQVLFRATSEGGFSMYDAEDDMSGIYSTRIQDGSGVNGINNTQLRRLMAGKDISLTQSIVLYNESMSGKYGVKDEETFFQLVYLYHVAPYFDQDAYNRLMKKERTEYARLLDDPGNYFNYQIVQVMNNGNPRRKRWPVKENLDQVNFDTAKAIYASRFGNATGFTFVFVGNIDLAKIKSYVLKYIGGLPADKSTKTGCKEQDFTSPVSPQEYVYHKGNDGKANVALRFVKKAVWSEKEVNAYAAFVEVLNTRLFESLRRDMSGVYGVHVSGSIERAHDQEATLSISFGTNPQSYKALCERALLELKRLMAEGPTADELERVKEKQRVALGSKLKENSYWLLDIFYAYRYGDAVKTVAERQQEIEQLNTEQIKQAAKNYVDADKVLKFVLLPEGTK